MDRTHLLDYIIAPTLDRLASVHPRLDGVAARTLLLGTAMVESDLRFVRQIGSGPALGLWQMEPATHDDIWENFLFFKPELGQAVSVLAGKWPLGPYAMVGNLFYACAMARILYWRSPLALPRADSPEALASYWKRIYNTSLGAGTVEKALPFFCCAVETANTE